MDSFTVFYSWQSDIDKKINNFFIKDCIEKALKQIKKEIRLEIKLDKDTENTAGSQSIIETILKKISLSQIFICDVSLVNNKWYEQILTKRKMPNPNIMIELGYAIKTLGWGRISCICNTAFGKIEDIPFDIKVNRISTYNLKKIKYKKQSQEFLVNLLKDAIKLIIDKYDELELEANQDNILNHDNEIFKKSNKIINEPILFESLDFVGNNQIINEYYYSKWDELTTFFKLEGNQYINQELKENSIELIKSIDSLNSFCSLNFHPLETKVDMDRIDYEENNIEITPEIEYKLQIQNRYKLPDRPVNDENWISFNKRRDKTVNELIEKIMKVKENYRNYRRQIKLKLYV